jgi:hypothetical protein
MYTCLWVPPAILFLLSLWGLIFNVRGFVFALKHTLFPAWYLFWIVVFLVLMAVGFMGMVWLVDLMMYRNANPVPIDEQAPCC